MTKQIVRIKGWASGQSPDDTAGPAQSFAYGRQVDFRTSPSVLQLMPRVVEQSGGVVTDLLLDMVLTPSGDIYSIGDSGNFYRRLTSDGSWVLLANLGEAPGGSLVYRSDQDAILIPLQTRVAFYGRLASSPILAVNKYAASASTDIAASSTGGGFTYTLSTSITESVTAQRTFKPDIEPLHSIKLFVVLKGTGDWTVTIHDDANTILGTSTITNANLSSDALNEFTFSTALRMLVKPNARTYHIHVTSTVADGTVAAGTSNDFSTADFQILANRFVTTTNGLHPALQFLQYTTYGNERYLSVHEPLEDVPTNDEWQRHRLTFPSGLEVCGLAQYQEFEAIACERQAQTFSVEYQFGFIFLWDGISTTYSQVIPVPEGSPRSLFSYENELYWHADGSWYKLVNQKPQRIRRFPGATEEFGGIYAQTAINPNMATVRKGVLLTGFPSSTNDTTIEHGVYSLGSLDRSYDTSFGLDYVLSSGSRFNTPGKNLKIGCVKNFGSELYISWRDDSNDNANDYGVDSVSPLSVPATSARVEGLWFDNGDPEKDMVAMQIKASFKTLPEGCTVTPIWRTARDGAWNNEDGTIQGVAGDTSVILAVDQRCNEIQVGAIIEREFTTNTNVNLRTIALQFDDLGTEQDF